MKKEELQVINKSSQKPAEFDLKDSPKTISFTKKSV